MQNDESRLYLHNLLKEKFPSLAVYYNPPSTEILSRPCIVYTLLKRSPAFANNSVYVLGKQFQVTILSNTPGIDVDPIFGVSDGGGATVVSNTSHVTNDIVHDVFTIGINTI